MRSPLERGQSENHLSLNAPTVIFVNSTERKPKVEIPPQVLEILYQLYVEESWDCERLRTLARERWAIEVSRPTLYRRLQEMRQGVPPEPLSRSPDSDPSDVGLDDESRLDRVIRDLYRASRVAHKQGDTHSQVKAADAFGRALLVRRKLREPLPPVPVGSTIAPALPAAQQPQVMTQEQLAAELAGELG